MKKILHLSFSIALLTTLAPAWACSCFPIAKNFCQTVAKDTDLQAVVMGVKTGDYYHGMHFRILQTFKGSTRNQNITIWGDNGGLCRLYLTGIAIGDTLIFALHNADTLGNVITTGEYPDGIEKPEDYMAAGCGVYALQVKNGVVNGYLDAQDFTPQQRPLADFLRSNCIQNPQKYLLDYTLYYADGVLQLGFETYLSVQDILVHAIDGRLIAQKSVTNWDFPYSVEVGFLPFGTYFITVLGSGILPSTQQFLVF